MASHGSLYFFYDITVKKLGLFNVKTDYLHVIETRK